MISAAKSHPEIMLRGKGIGEVHRHKEEGFTFNRTGLGRTRGKTAVVLSDGSTVKIHYSGDNPQSEGKEGLREGKEGGPLSLKGLHGTSYGA